MIGREGVLSRWSRRKLQSEQDSIEEDLLVEQQRGDNLDPVEPAIETRAESDQPPLTDADMPDLDSLDESSDYSGFMSPGVSEDLRNLALKKLFRSQLFNVCDGLDEYDEDYTSFESLGDIVTCDMKHQAAMEARKQFEEDDTSTPAEERAQQASDEDAQESRDSAAEQLAGKRPESVDPTERQPSILADEKNDEHTTT